MKHNIRYIFKKVKSQTFSYGKFLIDSKDNIIR